MDTTVLHNIIRFQYIQCYACGIYCLLAAFEKLDKQYAFAEVNNLALGITGCLGLAQAFSLTAAAQTSHSPMKKTLQYNMIFHLLFAFVVMVLYEDKGSGKGQSSTEPNTENDKKAGSWLQIAVMAEVINVAVNMWGCYFHEVPNPVEDEEDDDE